jgi:exopolysaccharide biosynthesis WecB/TagA/CpsF family protein
MGHAPIMTEGVDRAPFPVRNVLGVDISVARQREVIDLLLARLASRVSTRVAFANAHLLTTLSSTPGTRLLDGFLVLNDGIAVDLASLALYRSWFPENLNGTDLLPALLSAAPLGVRLFLYGAKPEVLAKASEVIADRFGCVICGAIDGFSGAASDDVATQMRRSRPDIVLVALGNPLQEEWIAVHAASVGAPLTLGVGAFFDFISGSVPRAPALMRRLRLEWLYRWGHEPGRLRRRYTFGIAQFSAAVLRQARVRQE